MANVVLDFSGLDGLAEGHQGDVNDSTPQPHTKYLGKDSQFADGIFNPIIRSGYMSPANNTFGTIISSNLYPISKMVYDNQSDIVYIARDSATIEQLADDDNDTTSGYLTVNATYNIKDLVLYEVNGQRSLVYLIDSNVPQLNAPGNTNINSGGIFLGYNTLDYKEGATVFDIFLQQYPTSVSRYGLRVSSPSIMYNTFTKIAQRILYSDIQGGVISGVSFACRNDGSAPTKSETYTISLELDANPATAPFTSRGAWSNAVTNYVINDTVTDGGKTYMCIQAHSAAAAANDEPGVGSNWFAYWREFAAPNGTPLISTTFDIKDIPVLGTNANDRVNFAFSSPVTVSSGYVWVVITKNTTDATTSLNVMVTTNNANLYPNGRFMGLMDAATDYWVDASSANAGDKSEMDIRLINNRNDTWTIKKSSNNTAINGGTNQNTGVDSFLHTSDNGLLYWFAGNDVHVVDGSVTGGGVGRLTPNVLKFPSYIQIAGVAETRSKIFIALNNTNYTDSALRSFDSRDAGVYIWDRRSQVAGTSDYISAPGAREIRGIFRSVTGDIIVLSKNNDGMSEIRVMSGNSFTVFKTFEKDGAPLSNKSIAVINNMNVWTGTNGIFYAFGKVSPNHELALYKIGDFSGSLTTGYQTSTMINFGNYARGINKLLFAENNPVQDGIMTEFMTSGSSNSWSGSTLQSVTFVSDGGVINGGSFIMRKDIGSPTGSAFAYIYLADVNGRPTGAALATSSNFIDISTIPGTFTEYQFTFPDTGTTLGTTYCFTVEITPILYNGSNYLAYYKSSVSASYSGKSYWSQSTWAGSALLTGDWYFRVKRYPLKSNLKLWYPNGIGNINTFDQKGNQGNVYSLVKLLPGMSTIKSVDIRCLPTTSTGSTVIGTVKYYFNQSSTPSITKSITLEDASRGYINHELNKPYVNAIQVEVEFNTTQTLGADDFRPYSVIVDYATTNTTTKDKG